MKTCRWVQCSMPGDPFCPEHGDRLAAAHTALDAERVEDQ